MVTDYEMRKLLDLPSDELIGRDGFDTQNWAGILWSATSNEVIMLSAMAALAWEGRGQQVLPERLWLGRNLLCNAAPTPFVMQESHFASVDSFYEAMKLPDGSEERRRCALSPATEAGRLARYHASASFTYGGRSIEVGSTEHRQLLAEAIVEKIRQNPPVERALIDTRDVRLEFPLTYTGSPNLMGIVTPFILMVERWKRSRHRP